MPRVPLSATYRVQMNGGFTFTQARARVDYFAKLGVSHLYCSPILAARRGSMHGYDVIDPTRINPELGGESDLRALSQDLQARNMALIVDIVPNHMAANAENTYWDDVLAHGERSPYARWFDIHWDFPAGPHRKLVLPLLGDELDGVLARGELSVRLAADGAPRITYFEHSFPIDPATMPPELQLTQFDAEETGEIAGLYGGAEGRDRLRALLDLQHYRLASARRGIGEINYRRFFDVSDLVGVRSDDPDVFEATHGFILRLMREGVIDGLRVDHVDGLLDPAAYLERLRAAAPPGAPIVVEKILSEGEQLRPTWPVQGTTGYEFLNDLEDVFIEPAGFAAIERMYRSLRRLGTTSFRDIAHAGKVASLNGALRADVERLAITLAAVARSTKKRWTKDELVGGLVEFIASLPVYRTYLDARSPIEEADRRPIEAARIAARARNAFLGPVVDFITETVLGSEKSGDQQLRHAFVGGLQQTCGPATAKGVEDTALYVYVPLVSRNEVGGAPDRPLEHADDRLHEANALRATQWPLGLISTNTHDTKRSADVRSRLDALTEIPHEWQRAVRRWRRLNAKHRRTIDGRIAPDTNTEYLLYQTLVALWPPPRPGRRIDDLPDRRWRDAARVRMTQYALKAAREAKTRTSWGDPDAGYEAAVDAFVAAILEPSEDAPFLADVARLVALIAPLGAWNALARVAVHLTSPGTPDLYQGDELWNFTLVDPDNRRQIDFDARTAALEQVAWAEERLHESDPLDPFDNRVKLLVTHRLLAMRRVHAELFARATYRRLDARGARARHIFAFVREGAGRSVVTIVSRFHAGIGRDAPSDWWADTAIELPPELRGRPWHSQIVPGEIAGDSAFSAASLFAKLPIVVAIG